MCVYCMRNECPYPWSVRRNHRYEEAEAAWRGALLQEQHLPGSGEGGGEGGGRPLELAACHSGLGRALGGQQRYGEAEQQHEVALRLRRAALGRNGLPAGVVCGPRVR